MKAHTLYRFFDSGSNLLYVGRTTNPRQRWRSHEKEKDWFNEVAVVTREVFETAEQVDIAERQAIATEGPRYNIALNPNRRADVPLVYASRAPVLPAPIRDQDHAARLNAIQENAPEACQGDETICECARCHDERTGEFGYLEILYGWHPLASAEIERVVQLYYNGAELFDWYYDFFDLRVVIRSGLAEDSKTRPLPAFAVFEDLVAMVDCPICGNSHSHVFGSGEVVSNPIDAGCAIRPGSARYRLMTDWQESDNALRSWMPKQAAA